MPLNPEPSAPEDREAQHLAPKSYADAAEEALHQQSRVDGTTEGTTDAKQHSQHQNHDADQLQFEGAGQDETPKSPARGSHRRNGSNKSNGSIGQKHTDMPNGDIYEKHQDGNGKPLTSVKPAVQFEKPHRTDGKPMRRNSELKSGRQAGAGWHRSKIRFAPLNVPLQRRLQTLAVLIHTLSIAGSLAIFFFLCAIPLLWPILLPYLVYVLFSNAGTSGELSFRSERARRLPVWSLFASYFPARLHRSQELEPTRKYIFGYHPHGIISHGAFAAFATEALGFSQLFPGITNTLLTLDSNFRLPLYREYALRMGLASVSRESIENILSKGGRNGEGMGRAVTVVVGGAREALDSHPGSLRLVLNRRKGFVKMAIRTGADLVPVIGFGENEIYEQLDAKSHPYVHKFQLLVKKIMGFTVPLFHARGIFNYDVGMMPYRRPLNIVVGRPICVVQDNEPDNEYVNRVHEDYVKELLRVWDDHKDTFAKQRTEELRIIE
ncbi:diacylglycerol O-acyltransferas-like protein 2B [Corynespora cassiicola Philippines]|uniref:Diacylglycerol O-acyltransferase n=1 Tax=Corynespora cassiicola Philippines TaxID=1448308 RepID=A0A2T2NIR7_CORCC|nr:diacylglycerol O-acyltransferas-like protein 2B [Corynespora cassiicola Philippines]